MNIGPDILNGIDPKVLELGVLGSALPSGVKKALAGGGEGVAAINPTGPFGFAGRRGWNTMGSSGCGAGLSVRLCVCRNEGALGFRVRLGDGFVGEMGQGAICLPIAPRPAEGTAPEISVLVRD